MFCQRPDVRQRQLPFAAQNHRPQRAMNVQQSRPVCCAQVVRVQQMLQRGQRRDLGRGELGMRFLGIFNEAAEQVKIVFLIRRQFVSGHGLRDFRDVFKIHLVVDGARRKQPAQASVVLGQAGKGYFGGGRFHKVSFQRSLLYSACVIKRRV